MISNNRVFLFTEYEEWYCDIDFHVVTSDVETVREYIQGCIGYACSAVVRGERPDFRHTVTQDGFDLQVFCDITKSARDDIGDCFADFWPMLADLLVEGSPQRKTKQNTRCIPPIHQAFTIATVSTDGEYN